MIRSILAKIALPLLLCAGSFAQTTTYTIAFPSPCVPSVGAPRYDCLGNLTNPAGSHSTEWAIYTGSINADGTFGTATGGGIAIDDFDDPSNPLYLNSTQLNGTEDLSTRVLNGTFSGTVTPGNPGGPFGTFTATFTNLTPGSIKRCNRWGKNCYYQRAIGGGTITVTMTLQ